MSVSSVVNTVSIDLKSEVARLTSLLETAKTTITSQAATIASHVEAALSSNSDVSAVVSTVKAKADEFEAFLKGHPVNATPAAAVVVAPALVLPVAQTVTIGNSGVAPVLVPAAANAVVSALDAAIHAGPNPPTLLNLNALEAAYAKIMAPATTSNSAAVPVPAHIAQMVETAQISGGVFHRMEGDVEAAATDVKNEVEKLASEVKAGVEEVAEGKVTIGPAHI